MHHSPSVCGAGVYTSNDGYGAVTYTCIVLLIRVGSHYIPRYGIGEGFFQCKSRGKLVPMDKTLWPQEGLFHWKVQDKSIMRKYMVGVLCWLHGHIMPGQQLTSAVRTPTHWEHIINHTPSPPHPQLTHCTSQTDSSSRHAPNNRCT